jgi:REP element-mobilizing transposase RayT
MKKKTQGFLPGFEAPTNSSHGGEHSIGKRKTKRPVATKKAMHIVMRATRAKGILSLRVPHNFALAEKILKTFAQRFSIQIYKHSINSNHIHIVLRAQRREDFQNYLRAVAGTIALKLLRANKSNKQGRFWDLLAFSRIIEWGRALKVAVQYVIQNQLEAAGQISYRPRGNPNNRPRPG